MARPPALISSTVTPHVACLLFAALLTVLIHELTSTVRANFLSSASIFY